jgi:hypothetical protein
MLSAIRDGGKIDFFDERNEATSIEEALKKDDYEIYVAKMPKLKENDLDFDPDMDEYENQWKKEDETDLESDGFEFKPEHIKKANKWGKTGNDELLSMFDAPDESSNDNIILAGENDPERMRLPLNEELVSIDGGGEVSQSVEAKSAPVPQNIK